MKVPSAGPSTRLLKHPNHPDSHRTHQAFHYVRQRLILARVHMHSLAELRDYRYDYLLLQPLNECQWKEQSFMRVHVYFWGKMNTSDSLRPSRLFYFSKNTLCTYASFTSNLSFFLSFFFSFFLSHNFCLSVYLSFFLLCSFFLSIICTYANKLTKIQLHSHIYVHTSWYTTSQLHIFKLKY